MPILLLLLLIGLFSACDRDTDPDAHAGATSPDANRPATVYGRRLLFLGGREAEPVALIFDYAALDAPSGAERGAGAWWLNDAAWDPLLDIAWTGTPIREPWRIVPHNPLRVIVDDNGEIEALASRATDQEFRLEPAGILGEWTPNHTAQYRVREGEIARGNQRFAGIVLDVQTGALEPDSPPPAEAFLTDGTNTYLIISIADSTASTWIQVDGRTETRDSVEISRTQSGTTTGWRIEHAGRALRGQLRAQGNALAITALEGRRAGTGEIEAVRGWVEVDGRRRQVFGIVRHGTE